MAGKNTAVFGIYRTRGDVENAVDTLRREGFRNTDISVLFPENEGTKDFAHEKNTKPPEGAATGAQRGAVVGGGWVQGRGRARGGGAGLDCLPESARLRSPDLVHSSLQDPSWLPWLGS